MKVFKKNVFIGSISLCEDITTNKLSAKKDLIFNSKKIERNVILIKTRNNTYVKFEELRTCSLPANLAKQFVTQYKLQPENKGDYFVSQIKPYYKNNTYEETEKIELRDIVAKSKTL